MAGSRILVLSRLLEVKLNDTSGGQIAIGQMKQVYFTVHIHSTISSRQATAFTRHFG
jgi:hypothetical protein